MPQKLLISRTLRPYANLRFIYTLRTYPSSLQSLLLVPGVNPLLFATYTGMFRRTDRPSHHSI